MKIKDILKIKGTKVWTVKESQSIQEALRILVHRNVGALLVMNERNLDIVGIISERDIVRGCYGRRAELDEVRVSEMMTRSIITASPEDDVEDLMASMTDHRVRHIPILSEGRLEGIVSIGDVVKSALQESEHQIRFLKEFMYGPGLEEKV